MKPNISRRSCLLTTARLLLVGVLVWPLGGIAQAANATVFSGRAAVLEGTVVGVPVSLVNTGPVSSSGGQLEASLLCYPNGPNCTLGVPDLTNGAASAEVLHAAVVARGDTSRAEASVANFSLSASGVTVVGDLLTARARATCTGNGAVVSGSADIVTLVVNGQTVTVTGEVNQKVPNLPLGVQITINEQTTSVDSTGNHQIDVTALHIVVPGAAPGTDTNLFVAQAHADITCGTLLNCPGRNDFVTGGGFIAPTGAKDHFAIAGMDGANWGHVLYKPTGLHVKNPFAIVFRTPADLDKELANRPFTLKTSSGLPGSFEGAAILYWTDDGTQTGHIVGEVLAIDMGEPGKGNDYFEIAALDAASNSLVSLAGGLLQGGNIQMHGRCPS